MDLFDLNDEVSQKAKNFVRQNGVKGEAKQAGLDPRCGSAYFHKDWIAVRDGINRCNPFDYYGGFEYVDKDNIFKISEFTFYQSFEPRVAEAIEHFFENQKQD